MAYSYKLPFFQGFISVLLYPFLLNAASIPSETSSIPNLSPSFHSLNFNSSALLNGTTRCVHPVPPLIPVILETCQLVFRDLLLAPDAGFPFLYPHRDIPDWPITIATRFGCVISLDRRGRHTQILISKTRIVDFARQILLLCQNFGQGGWKQIDGDEDWIVIVSGTMDAATLAVGAGGNGLSLEARDR